MNEPAGQNERAREVLALLAEYGELESAREEAYAYAERAQQALEIFPDNLYTRALGEIAEFIVERDR
jgi:geranylgeranyl pyrophosphate synthase